MTKSPTILDLDAFVTEKFIKFGGKERRVRSMTVGDFVNSSSFESKIKELNSDVAGQVNLLVDRIMGFIDNTERQELLALEQPQLFAIFAYIRGEDVSPKAEETKNE